MQPVSGGRHCSSCSKTIIDFSVLTDAEIIAVINSSKGAVCGRFADDQLHRNITAPATPRHPFMPAMLITAGLAVGIATASYAETRGLEQIEMNVEPVEMNGQPLPVADTSIASKARDLPEIVVAAYEMKKTSYATGMVCVRPTDLKRVDKPLLIQPPPVKSILYKNEPVTETKKKKRFLFF